MKYPGDRSNPDSRTSKGKAMSALSSYEKANHEARLDICVKKKIVNGKETVVATMKRDTDYNMVVEVGAKEQEKPLVREYTDMTEVGKCVAKELESIQKALA